MHTNAIKTQKFSDSTFTKKIRPVIYVDVFVPAGLIHGMFVSGGAFTVIYAGATMPDKDEFRTAMSGMRYYRKETERQNFFCNHCFSAVRFGNEHFN